jgi:lipopolysaccharide export system protein LptA
MTRNIVLLVCTTAVLVILFVGYRQLVRAPAASDAGSQSTVDELPDETALASDETLQVGQAQIPGGQGIEYTVYDERTGRPTGRFRCENWKPVPDSKNEVYVEQPELTMLLPSGMVALVSADEGHISVDRVQKTRVWLKTGWLRGDARIVIDTETAHQRSAMTERPEDLITITMDELEFDLELGELETAGPFNARSTEFDIAGVGIKLVWNQAENRVETLVVRQGRELTLYVAGGLFGGLGRAPQEATTATPDAATQPVRPPIAEQRAGRKARKRTAYACTLAGDIVAEHVRGDQLLGALEADELHLLFDVGGEAGRLLERPGSTSTAPASQPADAERERLVVHWSGSLSLEPDSTSANAGQPRRRFEAVGRPVTLTRGEGALTCGRLEYYDETGQIWLYAAETGRVNFAMRDDLSATAANVYIDRLNHVIKLIGDVSLESRQAEQADRRPVGIHCTHWAELHVDAEAGPAADEVVSYGRLKSAVFVGDVRTQLSGEALDTHRLEMYFRPAEGGESLEDLLTSALAIGDVRLTGNDLELACGQVQLAFGTTEEGERYPRELEAVGAVVITRERARLSGGKVRATLEPWLDGPQGEKAALALRTLDVWGKASVDDADNKVAARGEHITATFHAANELDRASVTGTPAEHAVVHYEPYAVRAERVELDRTRQTVHADGQSQLSFRTKRSLRGQRRHRPVPIEVASNESLDIDGQRNTVHFVGNVAATSGNERLRAEALTLLLEDVEVSATSRPAATAPLETLLRQAQEVLLGRPEPQAESRWGFLGFAERDQQERVRKEPLRLLARNAMVESETYKEGDPRPIVHSSIAAPELDIEIKQRIVHTVGETTLLMTDRRLSHDQDETRQTLGLPSALMTRGPSQTAMKCDKGMTYVVGDEGPAAQDQVLFEGGVVFRHVAGREMVNLEQMLPDVIAYPDLLAQLKSRNTYMECDRLECGLAASGPAEGERATGSAVEVRLRLSWLIASDNVYLRDQQESVIRTVHARQVEFDRLRSIVRVLGWQQVHARIYSENSETDQFDIPAIGPEFIIDLENNTIQAGETRGEFRRP